MSTSKATYTLNYFNRHGKVELCRLIFAAAQVSYEDNFIENLTDSGNRQFRPIFNSIHSIKF